MSKNTFYYLACVVFIYFCSSFTAYADKHTGKIIPIVKYHPENFTFHLERSFITTSYSNYIEIDDDAVQMYLYGTKHAFGSRDAFFKSYMPQKDILEKDSVFIFYLSTPVSSVSYKGYYPPM